MNVAPINPSANVTECDWVDSDIETLSNMEGNALGTNYLLCLYEELSDESQENVHFSFLVHI